MLLSVPHPGSESQYWYYPVAPGVVLDVGIVNWRVCSSGPARIANLGGKNQIVEF